MLEKIELGGFILLLVILLVYLVIGSSRKREIIVKPNKQIKTDKFVVPGSCRILEDKHCRTARHVVVNGNTTAAFKLEDGVPIYSPFTGVVTLRFPAAEPGSPKTYYTGKVSYIIVSEGVREKDRTKKYRRSILITYTGVEERGIKNGKLVKEGDILARTGGTNIDTQEIFKKYNLVAVFTKKKISIHGQL